MSCNEDIQTLVNKHFGSQITLAEAHRVRMFIDAFLIQKDERTRIIRADMPPIDVLKKIFLYDHTNGRIYWRCDVGAKIKAGSVAGSMGSWGIRRVGYTYLRRIYKMQEPRLAWALFYGSEPPKDFLITPIDGDHTNIKISNLELKGLSDRCAELSPASRRYAYLFERQKHKARKKRRGDVGSEEAKLATAPA